MVQRTFIGVMHLLVQFVNLRKIKWCFKVQAFCENHLNQKMHN